MKDFHHKHLTMEFFRYILVIFKKLSVIKNAHVILGS